MFKRSWTKYDAVFGVTKTDEHMIKLGCIEDDKQTVYSFHAKPSFAVRLILRLCRLIDKVSNKHVGM